MPKPVPIPVRRKLLQLAQQGQTPAHLAVQFGLPVRTVRHLLKRFRQRGEAAVRPDYRLPLRLPHAYAAEIREAALAERRAASRGRGRGAASRGRGRFPVFATCSMW